jgi:hypothetical protein
MNLKSKLGRRKVFAMNTIIGFDNSKPANKENKNPPDNRKTRRKGYFSLKIR